MRRAGIKKTDLPYYPANDQLDLMADLKKRESNAPWAKPNPYWILEDSN